MSDGLGAYIKREREARGWTQIDLAIRANLCTPGGEPNRTLIAQLETGRTKVSLPETRRAIAAALGVRHVDLLVAAGEITAEECGEGTTPVAANPEVESLCAGLRRVEHELSPNDLKVLRAIVAVYARPVVPSRAATPLPAPAPTPNSM